MFNTSVGAWVAAGQNIEMEEPYTPELINGVFTVNDSGKKVKFTKGNLYWNGSEFMCEANQYDYPTTRESGYIGHFFWSKTASIAYAANYNDPGRTTTDTFFAADGGAIGGYTVLSKDEWQYLIDNAIAKNSSNKITILIDWNACVVFKPDGFTGTVADNYTASQWVTAEASGLVALPFAGTYNGSKISGAGSNGGYWSSTPDEESAMVTNFNTEQACMNSKYRNYGYSVRLVQVQ